MAIEQTDFISRNLQDAEYDTDSAMLSITFSRGDSYVFANVPPEVWRGLQEAPSAGIYFNQFIRGRY